MRKIIDGRTYNTTTSKLVGTWTNGRGIRDFSHQEESLYKNTKGAYFIHGEGGPMSPYKKRVESNSWTGDEQIIPFTAEEAQQWAEEKLTADEYEQEFGTTEEAEPKELANRQRVQLTLADEVIEGLRRIAKDTGTPMSRLVDTAVKSMYGDRF